MKKIGIDARFIDPQGSGLSRYSENFIKNLEKLDVPDECHFYIFLRREAYYSYAPKNKRIHKVLADFQWYSLKEQLILPFMLYKHNLCIAYFCHSSVPLLYFKKQIILIPDLILFYREFFPHPTENFAEKIMFNLKYYLNKLMMKTLARKSCHIITISEFSKKEIIDKLKIREDKISVVYLGVDHIQENTPFKKNNNGLRKDKDNKLFLLTVGNAYPHKNLKSLCLALHKINNDNLHLIIAGKNNRFLKEIKIFCSLNKIKNVSFPGYVSNKDLGELYQKSKLFIFPSFIEGFGMPPLEALLSGTKVLASGESSMPEILGSFANYFNPYSITDIAAKIVSTLKIIDKKNNPQILLKKYTWRKNAQDTFHIIMEEITQTHICSK